MNHYFTLIVSYPDSSLTYRHKTEYRNESGARNAVSRLTLADPDISVIAIKQIWDLNSFELLLPRKPYAPNHI